MVKVNSAMKKKNRFIYPPSIVQTLEELACDVRNYAKKLTVFAKLDIGAQKHRASPHFHGNHGVTGLFTDVPGLMRGLLRESFQSTCVVLLI